MRFFALTSALVGAAMANNLEARWLTTSSSVATASASCVPVTTTCTVTVTAWGAKNTSAPATGYYVNGAGATTYAAWSVVAGLGAALLL